jgi:hypothetical protein
MARIRDGAIKVRGGIDHFTADGVAFLDATFERFDAVILATGFALTCARWFPARRACSTVAVCRLSAGARPANPVSIFAASPSLQPGNYARSASKRRGSPLRPGAISTLLPEAGDL